MRPWCTGARDQKREGKRREGKEEEEKKGRENDEWKESEYIAFFRTSLFSLWWLFCLVLMSDLHITQVSTSTHFSVLAVVLVVLLLARSDWCMQRDLK